MEASGMPNANPKCPSLGYVIQTVSLSVLTSTMTITKLWAEKNGLPSLTLWSKGFGFRCCQGFGFRVQACFVKWFRV